MLLVSWRLFACRREISSWMLTSDSEVTCRSSSILASSSAMGCSKSRKATAMQAYRNFFMLRASVRGASPGRKLGGFPGPLAAIRRQRRAGGGGERSVGDLHRAAPQQSFQALPQLPRGAHRPLRCEFERTARGDAEVFDHDRARARSVSGEQLGEARLQRRVLGPLLRPREDDIPRLLLADLAEISDGARRESPAVAEI